MKKKTKNEKYEMFRNLILSLSLTPEEKEKLGIKDKPADEKESSVRLYIG